MRFRSRCDPRAGTRFSSPIRLKSATILLLHRRHSYEMTHPLDHTTKRGRILLQHDILMMAKAERRKRRPHPLRMPNATPHLLDEHSTFSRGTDRRRLLRTTRAMPHECSRHAPPPFPLRATGTMLTDNLVRNRSAGERYAHATAPRRVHRLPHRLRHFVRLARRDADLTLPVAYSDQRIEREATTALHDLGDT